MTDVGADATAPGSTGRIPPTLATMAGITWRVLLIGFAVLILLWGVFQIAAVALAFFMALFVTALAGPIAGLLSRVMPKVVAVVTSLVLITVAGITVLVVVVRSIISEGPALRKAITDGINQLQEWARSGPLQLTDEQVSTFTVDAQKWLVQAGKDVAETLASDLGALGTIITAGSVFLFAVLFFMTSGSTIWQWLVTWMPARSRAAIDISGQLAWGTMAGYTRGVVVVAVADAVLVFIGLLILQVPLAPALAAIVFMGAFIPVIGAPIATLLAAVVALATRGPMIALLVVALTIVVGSFDGDVMQPLVMGRAVSLHPLAIVTIIAAGALTFGVIGALIAVPVVSSIYVVAKYLTGRDPDNPFPPSGAAPPGPTASGEGDAAGLEPA